MLGLPKSQGGGAVAPLQRAILWLSLTMGFAISFVSTPKLYELSVDWAVTSAGLGPVLTWLGSVVWFVVVALLAMLASNLALMLFFLLLSQGIAMLMARMNR